MTLETFTHIYFVGAGGIGMAAIERYFLAKGKKVAGYDRTPTALTDALVAEGVEMTFSPESESIPADSVMRGIRLLCTLRQSPTIFPF